MTDNKNAFKENALEYLDNAISDLKDIQVWMVDNGNEKLTTVRDKIAYASSVREFLLTFNCETHLARLGGTYEMLVSGKPNTIYYLLEETVNKDLRAFIRRVNSNVFNNYLALVAYRTVNNRLRSSKS